MLPAVMLPTKHAHAVSNTFTDCILSHPADLQIPLLILSVCLQPQERPGYATVEADPVQYENASVGYTPRVAKTLCSAAAEPGDLKPDEQVQTRPPITTACVFLLSFQ